MLCRAALIASILYFAASTITPGNAIVGGEVASDDLARAVVGVRGANNAFCTAALISTDLALTAGHCVEPGAESDLEYTDSGGLRQLIRVVEVKRHPLFII